MCLWTEVGVILGHVLGVCNVRRVKTQILYCLYVSEFSYKKHCILMVPSKLARMKICLSKMQRCNDILQTILNFNYTLCCRMKLLKGRMVMTERLQRTISKQKRVNMEGIAKILCIFAIVVRCGGASSMHTCLIEHICHLLSHQPCTAKDSNSGKIFFQLLTCVLEYFHINWIIVL